MRRRYLELSDMVQLRQLHEFMLFEASYSALKQSGFGIPKPVMR